MIAVYAPILLTVVICLFASPLGLWLGVIDHPDDQRKFHAAPTPLIGGIAVMAPLAVWCLAQIVWDSGSGDDLYLAILLCGGGVAVVGFMDDQRTISPTGRLILIGIFAAAALRIEPSLVTSRINTVTVGPIAVSPAVVSVLLVLALTGFSSAVNLADGLDGLVAALVCVWSVCIALLSGDKISEAAQFVAAAAFVTLLFNVTGKLFLGDCGAFAIAFVVGLLTVLSHNAGRLPIEAVIVWFFVPVADCVRLIPLRLRQGRSPFRPDRNHFHYRLGARLGERRATWIYVALVAATSLLSSVAPQFTLLALALVAAPYMGFLLADALAEPEQAPQKAPAAGNVISLDGNEAQRSRR